MVLPEEFETVRISRHLKRDKPISSEKVRKAVKKQHGRIYKDQKKDGYHLLHKSTAIVFAVVEEKVAKAITAYPNFTRDYNHSSRFSRIERKC